MTKASATDHRLLQEITLRNVLSFGPQTETLPMENLNVLIGPNGSGKSNLIETIALMRAAPGDMAAVIRRGGGVEEWIWKGNKTGTATIDMVLRYPHGKQPIRHVIEFRENNQRFEFEDERIENKAPFGREKETYFYYRFQQGRPVMNMAGNKKRPLARETINPNLSILAQRRDPELYPEVSYLAEVYEKIRLYREWALGRNTIFREPQKTDTRDDRLEEDFSNLGIFLNQLRQTADAKIAVLEALKDLYTGITDFDINIKGGSTVQVVLTEGGFTIPATRLSDGTLRYLCLLAILCAPTPPPLICIEEPELGLHPDILPDLADLLVEASNRTQLIVTTHSDILIDALTEHPEFVVVCEKHNGQTEMKRLNQEDLTEWLDNYRLGQLWMTGQIGGTRW
ncbi:MAG: AAA family ATPase [Acidobacteria bacterium]|nr:AAA family ATPase [Acidobacteriota bacterium]